jgi:hypothetical protein
MRNSGIISKKKKKTKKTNLRKSYLWFMTAAVTCDNKFKASCEHVPLIIFAEVHID